MRAAFYPNSHYFVPSSPINSASSANENHPLLLSDTDRIRINQQFLRQLNHCGFTQRECQIVTTIYSQTIDFNKFEDDMNGTRLKQLTGLYPHHANATIRDLEALHVLITRKGYYGKYLSINFNFSQWGQQICDEASSNDPTVLLNRTEQRPIEDNISASIAPNNQQQNANIAAPVLQTSMQQHTDYGYSHDLLKQLLDSMTILTAKVTRQEEILNDLLNNAEVLAAIKNKQQPQAEQNKEVLENKTDIEIEAEIEAEIKVENENQATEIETVDSNKPQNIVAEPVTKPDLATDNTLIGTTISSTALQFPTQFNPEHCQQAEKMLTKAGDKAQLLLDMLQKRLVNTHNPIRNPFDYLGGLLHRLQNNQLDMSTPMLAVVTPFDPCKPQSISALQQCKDDFREASADCQHMEQSLKLMANNDQVSFREYIQKSAIKEMWDRARNRFKETKQALEAMQDMNAVAI